MLSVSSLNLRSAAAIWWLLKHSFNQTRKEFIRISPFKKTIYCYCSSSFVVVVVDFAVVVVVVVILSSSHHYHYHHHHYHLNTITITITTTINTTTTTTTTLVDAANVVIVVCMVVFIVGLVIGSIFLIDRLSITM